MAVSAVGYVEEIEAHLEELQGLGMTTSIYEPLIPTLYSAVFGLKPHWSTNQGRTVAMLETLEFAVLRSLGQLIDARSTAVVLLPGAREELAQKLRDLADEVQETDYLPAEARAYLVRLLRHAAETVALASTSDDGVRSATLEAVGALDALARHESVPESERSRWRDRAADIATAVAGNIATSGLMLGAAEVVRQITN